jgi:hypothetical protein
MKHRPLILMVVVVILALFLSQCGGTAPAATTNTSTQPTISADTVNYVETTCSACHSFNRAVERGHSESEWAAVVDQMIANGLSVSSDQRATIIQYLAQVYP